MRVGGGRSLGGAAMDAGGSRAGPARSAAAALPLGAPRPGPAAARDPRLPSAASLAGGGEGAAFRPGSRGPPRPAAPRCGEGEGGGCVAAGVGRRSPEPSGESPLPSAAPLLPSFLESSELCPNRVGSARGGTGAGAVTGLVSLCPAPREGSRGEKAAWGEEGPLKG